MASEYAKEVQDTKEAVLGYSKAEWPVFKKSNGVTVSAQQLPNCSSCKVFKAEGEIDVPPSKALEYVLPGPTRVRHKWDNSIKSWEVLKQVDESTIVLRSISHSAAMGLIASREYIDLVTDHGHIEGTDMYLSSATGVDYPLPEDPAYVRGWNYPAGLVCLPVEGDPNKTRLQYIVQTDVKGMVPTRLVESALPSMMVGFFGNARKAIKDNLLEKH